MPSSFLRHAAAIITLCGAAPLALTAQSMFPAPTGHADWSRYTTPQSCVAAAERVRDSVWRSSRRDTLEFAPHEILPGAASDIARRCLTRFSAATASPLYFTSIFSLALIAHDEQVARTVVTRQLQLTPARRARGQILANAVGRLIGDPNAKPVMLSLAQEYVLQGDSLGADAVRERAQLHTGLAGYGEAVLDLSLMESEAQAVLDVLKISPTDPWTQDELFLKGFIYLNAQSKLATVTLFRTGLDSAFAQLAAAGLGPASGKQAPRVTGQFHFEPAVPAPQPAPAKPTHPASLVVFVSQDCGIQCAEAWATLRRLHTRQPSIPITLVARTRGWFRTYPPVPAAREAELLRNYFLDFLKLPGTLVVDTSPYRRLPPPDRRRVDAQAPAFAAFGVNSPLVEGFVINGDGRLVYSGPIGVTDERVYNEILAKVGGTVAAAQPKGREALPQ